MELLTTILVTALTTAMSATPSKLEIEQGALNIVFHEETGRLTQITYKSDVIAEAKQDLEPMTFAVGPTDDIRWLEDMSLQRKLLKVHQPSPDVMEITSQFGDYELTERYKVHADPPRLDRSARLINRGKETVKLRGFSIRTAGIKATDDGFYRFPRTWPPRSHPFRDMKSGRRRSQGGSVSPMLAQLSPKLTLIWITCSDDTPSGTVTEGEIQLDVNQNIQAVGYLRPNEPQDIGFASMIIAESDYWNAFSTVQGWLNSVNIKVPENLAPWVPGAVFYSFHPGGTIGSDWQDLGGFRSATERLLPSLQRLGITALWSLPIEHRSPYWPLDYYRFMDGLGTGDDYREMVTQFHRMGLHFIQDLVPHGGAPYAVHNQEHPEFMLLREDGSTLDYWLNDFARPDWQDYIAGVTEHYVREYDIDGYRVDACYGSKEANWDPEIPYPRASMARLWGGLEMLKRIRETVKKLKPVEGTILAEVQSTRHQPFSDMMFDFSFLNLCHKWQQESPAEFAAHLQEYLAEQELVEPQGAIWLRLIESHDSLRSQLWYGVSGMRAMYALSAWIDGVPMIYQEMDKGHGFELRRINDIRGSRPELSQGKADYRAVQCDTPGVFTCLRTLEDRETVVVINFNHKSVNAKLTWSGGKAEVALNPLEYTVIPKPVEDMKPDITATVNPTPAERVGNTIAFEDATEWFVDTAEGRLRDQFVPLRGELKPESRRTGIYWRLQGTASMWENELQPLHTTQGCVGVKRDQKGWTLVRFNGPVSSDMRLVEQHEGQVGLWLTGLEDVESHISAETAAPPEPDVTKSVKLGDVNFRVVGSDYIVSNQYFTVLLRRQGGVIRELRIGDQVVALDHDLYGDQKYFEARDARRMQAANDVECGIRISLDGPALRLSFEGQLRGFNRFATMRQPVWYRNEYIFTDSPNFTQKWSFRTEKSFENEAAFLASFLKLPLDYQFQFSRNGQLLGDGTVTDSDQRSYQTKGVPAPDNITFIHEGKRQWHLENLKTPDGYDCNVFVAGNLFFIAFLDGAGASMKEGQWYEFQADWHIDGLVSNGSSN
ncbi:alpha-amylase family glycosyl hydrolase [Candidatus Poribacteria bacterium]